MSLDPEDIMEGTKLRTTCEPYFDGDPAQGTVVEVLRPPSEFLWDDIVGGDSVEVRLPDGTVATYDLSDFELADD
jgi:hypothetical protein